MEAKPFEKQGQIKSRFHRKNKKAGGANLSAARARFEKSKKNRIAERSTIYLLGPKAVIPLSDRPEGGSSFICTARRPVILLPEMPEGSSIYRYGPSAG